MVTRRLGVGVGHLFHMFLEHSDMGCVVASCTRVGIIVVGFNVSRHGDIKHAFGVVPLETYATEEVAVPIFSEFIFFLMQFIRWSMSS